jgi:hypothetical protein
MGLRSRAHPVEHAAEGPEVEHAGPEGLIRVGPANAGALALSGDGFPQRLDRNAVPGGLAGGADLGRSSLRLLFYLVDYNPKGDIM